MDMQENVDLRSKTTLRIGGTARYYTELLSKEDCEEAIAFTKTKGIPLVILGGGSNTIFADGVINALVVKIKADTVLVEGSTVQVQTGKHLANLINELAEHNLDLSPLTGIPGTIGGAIYGNSGQGFGGTWIDSYVDEVEVFEGGAWKTMQREDCGFGYRTSGFKRHAEGAGTVSGDGPFIIWSCILQAPSKPKGEIEAEIERLLQKRIETQPHAKTAGSIFLSKNKDAPAWKLIDAALLRGASVGGVEISEKHANFLINKGNATFEDAKKMVEKIQSAVPEDMHVEMRFVEEDGTLAY